MAEIKYQTKVKRRKIFGRVSLYLISLVMILITAFPYLWTFLSSLKPKPELFARPPTFLPQNPTLGHYFDLFSISHFPIFLKNTVIVCLGAVVLSMVLSVMAGYSAARFRYRGRKVLAYAVLFSYMLPQLLTAIPMFLIFNKLNLVNTYLGLIIAITTRTCPFTMWLLWGFFKGIPYELEECACIDGASRFRAFFSIILPLALPGIVAASIFAFALAWNNYTYPLILTTSESMKLVTVGLARFASSRATQWGMVHAGTIIATLPGLFFFWLVQKKLIQGWGAGGVKG